jgi:hypothetical protein
MSVVLKPDIREQVGVAVNASRLEIAVGSERALDRVAALGAAALAVSYGADLERLPVAACRQRVYGAPADVRDQLAAELGQLLWHIRYGAQHGNIFQAVRLYARWLKHRRMFEAFTEEAHTLVLERFAARVLHEWLSDRCIACGGSGKKERSRNGQWIKPRGSMQRDATFRPCDACHGSGRARPSHSERARWLEIPYRWYESERWPQRFNTALTWLRFQITHRMKRPLTAQLERRTRHF